jgi:hypothetical protein
MHKVKYDTYMYVDPRDAKLPSDMANQSAFVMVVRDAPVKKAVAPVPTVPSVPGVATRTAVKPPAPATTPAVVEVTGKATAVVSKVANVDIRHMTFKQVADLTLDTVTTSELLQMEKSGLNRNKVVQYLEGIIAQ